MSTPTNPVNDRDALVAALASGDANTHLALAWSLTGGEYRIERADIAGDISTTFLEQARAAAKRLAGCTHIDYDPEWLLRDYEFFELAESEVQAESLFASLRDFSNLKRLTKKRLTKPQLYVVCVQTDDGVALFGRKMSELKVLKQTASVFAAVWDGDSFNALGDSVATFANTFDWICWKEHVYVLDGVGFHRIFRDTKALTDAVDGHIDAIVKKIGVQNSDLFRQRCARNVAMASKLKRISASGLHLTYSIQQLKDYAIEYGLAVTWEGDELVFENTLSGQWEILKLLDEDRTEGPVSHRRYESGTKREVKV